MKKTLFIIIPIFALLLIIIACFLFISAKKTDTNQNIITTNVEIQNKKNPYNVTKEFDGIYTFKEYTSDNKRSYICNNRSFSI